MYVNFPTKKSCSPSHVNYTNYPPLPLTSLTFRATTITIPLLYLPLPTLTSPSPTSSHTPMKDLSLFIFKNSLSAKMKKGIQSFCSNNTSTSTLCQSSNKGSEETKKSRSLEEMIMQLEMEEEEARRSKPDGGERQDLPRRMSCVDGMDIMKSARNALNQYPRFSLDGRDAMYRSSFRNFVDGRKSFCGGGGAGIRMPPTVAGERVVWCKPGVVAKLMGLDAVPVPVGREGRRGNGGGFVSRKESLRRMGKLVLEKERMNMNLKSGTGLS